MTHDFYNRRKLKKILKQEKYATIQESIYQLTKLAIDINQKLTMLQ